MELPRRRRKKETAPPLADGPADPDDEGGDESGGNGGGGNGGGGGAGQTGSKANNPVAPALWRPATMSASALRAYTKELADTDGSDLTKEDIEWAAGLSDEQAQGATRRAKLFKAGQEYFHDVHGHGAVKAVAAGFVVKMHFKDGDQDFRLREHGTLRLIVQDADNYTAESLFKLADTDGSGHINLAEFTFIHAMMKEAQEKHERLLLEVKKTDKAHKLITGSRVSSASGQHLTLPG